MLLILGMSHVEPHFHWMFMHLLPQGVVYSGFWPPCQGPRSMSPFSRWENGSETIQFHGVRGLVHGWGAGFTHRLPDTLTFTLRLAITTWLGASLPRTAESSLKGSSFWDSTSPWEPFKDLDLSSSSMEPWNTHPRGRLSGTQSRNPGSMSDMHPWARGAQSTHTSCTNRVGSASESPGNELRRARGVGYLLGCCHSGFVHVLSDLSSRSGRETMNSE